MRSNRSSFLFFFIAFIMITSSLAQSASSGKKVIEELEKNGFFKLTNTNDIEASKKELIDSYNNFKFFEGKATDNLEFTDNRFYFIDCEALYEVGGLETYLKLVKTSFDKLNLKLEFSNEKMTDAFNGKGWHHSIDINGKTYVAFDGKFSYKDWDIAFINFIQMLNDQLQLQGSDEQFYPISSDNDGRMVLLTPKLYQIVQKYYPQDDEHPMELKTWRTLRRL